jgi:hypothetical protein
MKSISTHHHPSPHLISSDHNRSQQITTDHIRSQQITTDHNRSQQITTDHNRSHQITTDHIRSQQITTDHNRSQQITTRSQQITLSASCAVVQLDHVADHTRFPLSPPLMCLVWEVVMGMISNFRPITDPSHLFLLLLPYFP